MPPLLNHHPRVLCFGRDERLLKTRRLVLAAHYRAVGVGSLEEMQSLPQDQIFDVILLCHTLSTEECDIAAAIARKRWPVAKIAALTIEEASCQTHAQLTIRGPDGPRRLIQAIDQLVTAQL